MLDFLNDNPWVILVVAIVIVAALLTVIAIYIIAKLSTSSEPTIDELVDEVLAGVWGSGEERKTRLTSAGYDYEKIQAAVNKRLGI